MQDNRISLDGTWEFLHVADDRLSGPAEVRQITVPSPWQAQFADLRMRAGLAVAFQDDVQDRAAVGVQRGGRIRDDFDAGDVGAAHGLQRRRAVFSGPRQQRRRLAVDEHRDLRIALDRDLPVGRHRHLGRRLQHVLRGAVGRARRVADLVDGLVELSCDGHFFRGDGDRRVGAHRCRQGGESAQDRGGDGLAHVCPFIRCTGLSRTSARAERDV